MPLSKRGQAGPGFTCQSGSGAGLPGGQRGGATVAGVGELVGTRTVPRARACVSCSLAVSGSADGVPAQHSPSMAELFRGLRGHCIVGAPLILPVSVPRADWPFLRVSISSDIPPNLSTL